MGSRRIRGSLRFAGCPIRSVKSMRAHREALSEPAARTF
jgi:hypothetical protein